jgi:uncharacterized protein (DUF2249 family)
MAAEKPAITPELTVGDLLRHYPDLDEPLACAVPAYRALPPAMRTALGPSMTLHRLAATGDVSLGTLITRLREAAGITEAAAAGEGVPDWTRQPPAATLDARPMLAVGSHPVHAVMEALDALKPGEVYQLIAPFVPGPLIEMGRGKGFEAYAERDGDIVRTYFRKA